MKFSPKKGFILIKLMLEMVILLVSGRALAKGLGIKIEKI